MKKMNIFIFVWILPLVISAKIPLRQAIRNGILLNLKVQNTILDTKQSQLEERNSEVQKWFSANLGGYYLYKSEQMEIRLPDMQMDNGVTIPMEPITVGTKNNYDFRLAITQPLYTGNILSNATKMKRIQTQSQTNNTMMETIDIIMKIKNSFIQHKLLSNKLESLKIFIRKLNLHHKKIQDYYQEDLVKKIDLLETQAQIQEQVLNQEEIENQIHLERINFKSLSGIEIDEVFDKCDEEIQSFPESLLDFKNHHPFLKTLNDQLSLLQLQKKIINGSYLPRLAGFAELHYARPGIDYFNNEWMFYFQGGINVDIKLFDWNCRKRNLEVLRYSLEKVKNQRQDFIQNVEKNLIQLYESKKSAEKRLDIIKNLIEISEEDIGLKEELFREQQIDNIDYLASLTAKERYVALENAIKIQLELIKISINATIGKQGNYLEEEI